MIVDVQVERRAAQVVERRLDEDHRARRVGDVGLGDLEVAVGRRVHLLPGQRRGIGQRDRVRGAGGLQVGERGSVGHRVLQAEGVGGVGLRVEGVLQLAVAQRVPDLGAGAGRIGEAVTDGSFQLAAAPGAPGAGVAARAAWSWRRCLTSPPRGMAAGMATRRVRLCLTGSMGASRNGEQDLIAFVRGSRVPRSSAFRERNRCWRSCQGTFCLKNGCFRNILLKRLYLTLMPLTSRWHMLTLTACSARKFA